MAASGVRLLGAGLVLLMWSVVAHGQTAGGAPQVGSDITPSEDPFKDEYPDIISPVTDCPAIAEKYRQGGGDVDALGYPADFGFSNLSDADQQACINEINKDGDIDEAKEAEETENILQN